MTRTMVSPLNKTDKFLTVFYDHSFKSFPWRIGLNNGHLSSETTRDGALRSAIAHVKYSSWGKFKRIKVYDEFNNLSFIITRVKTV